MGLHCGATPLQCSRREKGEGEKKMARRKKGEEKRVGEESYLCFDMIVVDGVFIVEPHSSCVL